MFNTDTRKRTAWAIALILFVGLGIKELLIRHERQKQFTTNNSQLTQTAILENYDYGYCLASWYGEDYHGKTMANGRPYDMYAHTCAHRDLPFGTVLALSRRVKKEPLSKGLWRGAGVRSTAGAGRGLAYLVQMAYDTVTVTDRGPFINGRELDLSYASAQKLKMLDKGVDIIYYEVINPPSPGLPGEGRSEVPSPTGGGVGVGSVP